MSIYLTTRREFLRGSTLVGAGVLLGNSLRSTPSYAMELLTPMQFGMVTYLWGQDWDLPTLIENCKKAGYTGVELRTEHAHKVESGLNATERAAVKQRFADSGVVLVGMGTNFAFHYPDQDRLRKEIEAAKEYVKLSADCGGSGVKVKPNDLVPNVPQEKTIQQIGKSLNELGKFAVDHGQQIRLEVHGTCSQLPVIKAIMNAADHPNVRVCWNCNPEDLLGQGLEANFRLVRPLFGQTLHVRELNATDYPYQRLMNLLVDSDYDGWVLLEGRVIPKDPVKAMIEQRQLWFKMIGAARGAAGQRKTPTGGVKITEHEKSLTVEINGKLFTEYCCVDVPRPYFYPIMGPTDAAIIRHWPMKEGVPDEEHDHPHHKSLWFSHGSVNGIDFWTDGDKQGKIVHETFTEVSGGPLVGVIRAQNRWVGPNGKIVCTDTRTHRFYNRQDDRIMDFEITIRATNGKVTFGDTKEGSLGIRLAPTMQAEGKVAKGHIINSEGQKEQAGAWGKRAAWCDCYGPVNDQIVGVAIFDHPSNPRYPTWWHVRGYGLFAANPFGQHDFESKPAGTGDLVIPDGGSVTFRWRFYFHKGDATEANVAERYREYTAGR